VRVLEIGGDDDYGVLNFLNSKAFGKRSYTEVWDLVKTTYDGNFRDDDEGFYINSLEFPKCIITEEFFSFLQDLKDYDETKHHDWFLVD